MNPITIFRGTTGLNTVDDPVMLKADEAGHIALSKAIDITIEKSGRPITRKGKTKLQDGNFHSLFRYQDFVCVVKEDILYQVAFDGSLQEIKSGLTLDRKMTYAGVGDKVYYSNGIHFGYFKDGVDYVWSKGVYTGPDTNRTFNAPIPGQCLEHFSGRMFIASSNVLWWSELYDFTLYDLASSFLQFNSPITMLCSVDSGLFLSTERNTYFLAFNNNLLVPRKVLPYPSIANTVTKSDISAALLNPGYSGKIVAWASREGVIIGINNGTVINLNRNKIIYPDTLTSGFGCFAGYHFIHGLK